MRIPALHPLRARPHDPRKPCAARAAMLPSGYSTGPRCRWHKLPPARRTNFSRTRLRPGLPAVRSTKKRKPTPCTLPDTKNRLASVSTATLQGKTRFCSRAIVAKLQRARDGICAPCEFIVHSVSVAQASACGFWCAQRPPLLSPKLPPGNAAYLRAQARISRAIPLHKFLEPFLQRSLRPVA